MTVEAAAMKSNANTAVPDEQDARPPDIASIRETALRLIGPAGAADASPPTGDELATLTATLRGHMDLLIPEVAVAAGRMPKDNIPRYCALACVGEARGKLRAHPSPGPGSDIDHARKLARSLNALCDHWENLNGTHTGASR